MWLSLGEWFQREQSYFGRCFLHLFELIEKAWKGFWVRILWSAWSWLP